MCDLFTTGEIDLEDLELEDPELEPEDEECMIAIPPFRF